MERTCGVLLILGLFFTFYQPTAAQFAELGTGTPSGDKTYKAIWTGSATPFANQAEAEMQCLMIAGGTLAVIDNIEVLQDLKAFTNMDLGFGEVDRNAKYYVNGKKAVGDIAFRIPGSEKLLPYHEFGPDAVAEITDEVCICIEKGTWSTTLCSVAVATHAFCQTTVETTGDCPGTDCATPALDLTNMCVWPGPEEEIYQVAAERCSSYTNGQMVPLYSDAVLAAVHTEEFFISGNNYFTPLSVHTSDRFNYRWPDGTAYKNTGVISPFTTFSGSLYFESFVAVNQIVVWNSDGTAATATFEGKDVKAYALCMQPDSDHRCSFDGVIVTYGKRVETFDPVHTMTIVCDSGYELPTEFVSPANELTCNCKDREVTAVITCEDIDDCLVGPCQNGDCIDLVEDYHCDCPPGYTGKDCETLVDTPCSLVTCENGGTCLVNGADPHCACVPGFTGDLCGDDVCTPDPCLNGGTCSPGVTSGFTCACPPGYTGEKCETDIDECASGPCQNSATCIDDVNSYWCKCPPGFSGPDCEDVCTPDPCLNGGTCSPGVTSGFTCACPPGYTGEKCETDIDECASDPCQNSATCIDDVDRYWCKCPPGFSGQDCEVSDGGGSDPCLPDPCWNGGTCSGTTAAICACLAGFSGVKCEENIDECVSDPCQNSATCIDDVDRYWCKCPPGYSGPDCEVSDGGGSDPCLPDPCWNGGTCSGTTAAICACLAGFSGVKCEENIDECVSDPCQNSATCIDDVDRYWCKCPSGYSGPDCEDQDGGSTDPCVPDPCQNGGTCSKDSTGTVAVCACRTGFSGDKCQENIDECVSDPCQNSATCIDVVEGYWCKCTQGYSGLHCEVPDDVGTDPCVPDLCQNGGTCSKDSTGTVAVCDCRTGFSGDKCQENIDECASNPCKDSKCFDGVNGYECICKPGYGGSNCEGELDCRAKEWICENKGACAVSEDGEYACLCKSPYSGDYCEVKTDLCEDEDCGEGECKVIDGKPTCKCDDKYTGEKCEEKVKKTYTGAEVGYIVGGVLGGACLLLLLPVTFMFLTRRPRYRGNPRRNRRAPGQFERARWASPKPMGWNPLGYIYSN